MGTVVVATVASTSGMQAEQAQSEAVAGGVPSGKSPMMVWRSEIRAGNMLVRPPVVC